MSPGCDSNTAYLRYRRAKEAIPDGETDGLHVMRRGSSHAAAGFIRAIIATDGCVQTAHDVAAAGAPAQLPPRVAGLLIHRRTSAAQARRIAYRKGAAQSFERAADREQSSDQHISRGRDHGLDYGNDVWRTKSALEPQCL